jgi:uncharacterized membrane protein (DUF4010 family)
VTTVALAKSAREANRPRLYSGGILLASGVMYLRLIVLLMFFNRELLAVLGPWFAGLGLVSLAVGGVWSQRPDDGGTGDPERKEPKNPLELDAAFFFAFLFIAILVVTHLALTYLGRGGVYGLAGLMGLTDVDPFIIGMTQTAGTSTPLALAAGAIAIAASSNNALKGVYAYVFADRETGRTSLLFLLGLAALGLLPLLGL